MGIIILPIFIGAFIIFIKAVLRFIPLIQGDEISNQALLIGLFIPIIIIVCTFFYWMYKKRVYVFQPYFTFLFSLIYLPMMVGTFFNIQDDSFLCSILTTWIIASGILMIPLFNYLKDYLKGKGVKFYY